MKNRIRNMMLVLASAVCAIALVAGTVPVTAYAAEDEEWSGEDLSDEDLEYLLQLLAEDDDDSSSNDDHDDSSSGDTDTEYIFGELYAPTDIRMTKGDSVGVDAAVYTNADYWRLEWSVSGSAVSVSGSSRDTANLYAQKVGTATVTVRLIDGDGDCLDEDDFTVNVAEPKSTKVSVTGVSVNVSSMSLKAGETGRIRASVYPLNATNKDINWSTSNSDIVSVDGDGLIRARKAGDATIYARSAENGATATCKVHVTNDNSHVRVTGIAVDSHDVSIKAGGNYNPNVRVTPSNASNKGYTGTTSNADIAFVANGVIYGVNNGSCVVTFRTSEGDHVSRINVTVYGATQTSTLNMQTVRQAVNGTAATGTATTAAATTATGHDAAVQFGYLQQIAAAAPGSTVTLKATAPSAYDVNVLNAIKLRSDVKVVAEFPFQNIQFQMVVPATFDATNLLTGGYVDWLTLCNYQAQGIVVTPIGAAQ